MNSREICGRIEEKIIVDIFAVFSARFPYALTEKNFSFSAHTTIGCGGRAALAVSPRDTEECAEILCFLRQRGIPHLFLGAGANSIADDESYDGVVVRFAKMKALFCDGTLVYAGAGVGGAELLKFAKENGVGGFEPLAGIPTSVGGGTAMNAGIRDGHFCDWVERVVAVDQGKIRTLSFKECGYSEKNSVFLSGIAVAGVYLRGIESFAEEIETRVCYYRTRRANLPKGRSMGCTFVNPVGQSAGEIIDRCGLKNLRVGGAFVSPEHANFIINEGGTSSDVKKLIEEIKIRVKARAGIVLREEIRRITEGSKNRS